MLKKACITAGVIAIPALWFLVSRIAGNYIVPDPWTTLRDTAVLLGKAASWQTIVVTVGRVGLGFVAAFFFGAIVGVASVKPAVEYLLRPLILLMQGVPPILWSIPLILIMGYSGLTPVVVIAFICFPLVATTIAEGMRSIPVELREMLDIFAPGFWPRLRELVLPHLRPFIAASVRLGIGLGIKASVVAEYFAANNGIGFEVQTAYQAFMVRALFSWALVLVVLILIADVCIRGVFRFHAAFPGPREKVPSISVESADSIRNSIQLFADRQEIELEHISFNYPEGKEILRDINLSIAPEETAVISGDSGVGKTTLLKIVAGLVKATAGTVKSPENLGFMFQDDRFLPWRNCMSNAALGRYYRSGDWTQSCEYAQYFMEQVGLREKELVTPDELSGGMKKRLSFARCFTCLPGAVLLDEPFTGLHHEARAVLWSLFSGLIKLRPAPVVIVTHFPEEVPRGSGTLFYRLEGTPASLKPV